MQKNETANYRQQTLSEIKKALAKHAESAEEERQKCAAGCFSFQRLGGTCALKAGGAGFQSGFAKNPPLSGAGDYLRECSLKFRDEFAFKHDSE